MSNGRREIVGGWKAVPLTVMNDPNLNHLAKFLYTWLITRPDDWEYTVAGTASAIGMSRNTVDKYLSELRDYGYLVISDDRDGGKFAYVWTFLSEPGAQNVNFTGPQSTGSHDVSTTIEESKVEERNKPPSKSSPRALCTLPDDWEPDERHRWRARDFNLDCALEVDAFRNYYLGTGKKHKDWDRAFHNWLINAYKFANPLPSRVQPTEYRRIVHDD